MKRRITLHNVCACGVTAALEILVQKARKHLGPNHRPCPDLAVLKVEEHMVPLGIDLTACHAAYGIFTERPSPHNPLGRRVLGISVQLCAACPNRQQAGAPGNDQGSDQCSSQALRPGRNRCREQCHGCANACCAELTVHITQLPEFPLPPADVDWFLYHYFNMHDLAAAAIPEGYRYLYDVSRQFQAAAQPAQRRGPGAPQLYCNVWLFNQMCVLPDPRACSHLRGGWQELYLEEIGVPPEDWEKSFRAAARYCRLRILHARGEPHSLSADDQADDQADDEQDGEPPA
jgi:hypothetical protein